MILYLNESTLNYQRLRRSSLPVEGEKHVREELTCNAHYGGFWQYALNVSRATLYSIANAFREASDIEDIKMFMISTNESREKKWKPFVDSHEWNGMLPIKSTFNSFFSPVTLRLLLHIFCSTRSILFVCHIETFPF
jgi:hypothetical protein